MNWLVDTIVRASIPEINCLVEVYYKLIVSAIENWSFRKFVLAGVRRNILAVLRVNRTYTSLLVNFILPLPGLAKTPTFGLYGVLFDIVYACMFPDPCVHTSHPSHTEGCHILKNGAIVTV